MANQPHSPDRPARIKFRELLASKIRLAFNPNQPRDKDGQWSEGVSSKVAQAVDEIGAGTLEQRSGEAVTTGIMVGMGNTLKGTLNQTPKADFSKTTVRNWLRRKAVREALSKNNVRAKIGVWEQDGVIFMEPSEQFVNKGMAVTAGKKQGEYSIYDIDNEIEIPTSPAAMDDIGK